MIFQKILKMKKGEIRLELNQIIRQPNYNEYHYLIYVRSNSGKIYESCSEWYADGQTSKEAKEIAKQRIVDSGAIDRILDDQIMNTEHGNPYFSEVNNVHPIFSSILNSLTNV